MNRRIEDMTIEYAASAPIPRIVLYDIGFPNGEKEYAALDGNAVILFTAISQNREELCQCLYSVKMSTYSPIFRQTALHLKERRWVRRFPTM